MKFELKQHFHIESARFLTRLPKNHPCGQMHGHSFRITLRFIGEQDPNFGWVLDYNEISEKIRPLLAQLDHRVLNEIEGLENPTSENLAAWVFAKSHALLPKLVQVTIAETPNTECSFPIV